MKKHCTHAIIKGAQRALCLPVLWRCIWAREPQENAMRSKEGAQRMVIELPPIVRLKGKNR